MNNQKTKFLKNKKSEIMRKLILSLVLVLSTSTFFAQSVFDKFEDQEGITAVVVNKKMFALLSKMENACTKKYSKMEGTMYRSANSYCHLSAIEWMVGLASNDNPDQGN